MNRNPTFSASQTVNFSVGLALLVMLFPIGGEFQSKPAGVRTAIETLGKKLTVRPAGLGAVKTI